MKKKIHLKRKKKIKKIWIIIILSLILLGIASKQINKSAQNYAVSQVKKIISQNITTTINQTKIDKNIFKIEKSNEQITSIDLDNEVLNQIITEINKNIQNKLDSIENTIIFKMPLFAPLNNIFLANIGPKIPIKYKTISNIINNLRTEVKNYGINNALITTYADIKIESNIILPTIKTKIEVVQTIPLATKIIQGQIPNYYLPIKNSSSI